MLPEMVSFQLIRFHFVFKQYWKKKKKKHYAGQNQRSWIPNFSLLSVCYWALWHLI